MGHFERSWTLLKASAAVLRADRRLLLLPLLSSIASLVVIATFALPLAGSGGLARFDAGQPTAGVLFGFAFYFVQFFVIVFFNAALVAAARMHLDGQRPSLSAALGVAASHWLRILGYAAIAATVGVLLRAIEERAGWFGRIVAGLFGAAWTVATFLVVPVLVHENIGPLDAVKRSAQLLRQTWGENLIGTLGLGFVFGLFYVGWALLAALIVGGAIAAHSTVLIVLGGVVVVLGFVLLGLIHSALNGVYAAVLYRYAQTGDGGAGFDGALVAQAFRSKA